MLDTTAFGSCGRRRVGNGPGAVAGLALIVVGAELLSGKLDFPKLMELLQYWPVFLVLCGIAILFDSLDGRVRR